ncbi:general transcription factor 3C polypeptide 6-like [Littorina saxatilis]|uniref:Transcription factor TFIIIC triple barrel domain-containing protein n=1 Tax=Littorina saxatilis TaxID=31220 RepID=A0AAN9B7H5_9CAEN
MADDWEDDMIVYVELDGVPGGQLIPPGSGTHNHHAEILGIASERPVLHINGQDFVGQYEDSIGTALFLEKKEKGGEPRKPSSKDPSVEYVCKTDKKLVMQPAFLCEKTSVSSEPASEVSADQTGSCETNSKDKPSTVTAGEDLT